MMSKGLTLIELMITMAVLAIITAIAIPAYNGYVGSAYRAECSNEVAAIELALNENFLERNTYFLGADILAIRDNSNGLYTHGFPTDAAATASNCSYAIVAGATGNIATSFQLTATGQNELNGEGCIIRKPTDCP